MMREQTGEGLGMVLKVRLDKERRRYIFLADRSSLLNTSSNASSIVARSLPKSLALSCVYF
jgi:hypothetical protein